MYPEQVRTTSINRWNSLWETNSSGWNGTEVSPEPRQGTPGMILTGSISFPRQSRKDPGVERQSIWKTHADLTLGGILARISRGKRPGREKVPRVVSTLINWFERLPVYGHRIDFNPPGHHKRGPKLLNFCFPLWKKVISKVSTPAEEEGASGHHPDLNAEERQSRRY